MKYRIDKDLDFLKDLSSRDLDKLVRILTETDPRTEELTKKDIFKEFRGEHNIYWKEIVAELQHYGGNTIVNTIRGEGITYYEILKDVCKSFNIEVEEKSIISDSLFSKLVNKALDMEIDLSHSTEYLEEQFLNKFTEDELEKVLSQSNPKINFKDIFLTNNIFLIKKISDPNFQVTSKSVYEIAKLRKSYTEDSQVLSLSKESKKTPISYTDSLIILNERDEVSSELKVIDQESITDIDFLEVNSEINREIQFLSDLVKSTVGTSSKTVELIFSKEGVEFMRNKNGEVLSILVDIKTKRMKEIPRIKVTGQTKQLLTGGYQLLSIAVAQSHLADIEKSLSAIKSSIESIQDKLEAEDKANLNGTIRYIENKIIPIIKHNNEKNEIFQEYKNEFQSILRDRYMWEDKILEEFTTLNKNIKQLNNKDTFGTRNSYEELKTLLRRIEPLKERYGLILKLTNLVNVIQNLMYLSNNYIPSNEIKLSEFENLIDEYNNLIDSKKELLIKSNVNKDYILEERKNFIDLLRKKQNNGFDKLILEYQEKSQRINEYFESFENGTKSIIISIDEESGTSKYALSSN